MPRTEPSPDHAPVVRAIRDRLVARAFLFEHPREYVAGVDDVVRALERALGTDEDPSRSDDRAAML